MECTFNYNINPNEETLVQKTKEQLLTSFSHYCCHGTLESVKWPGDAIYLFSLSLSFALLSFTSQMVFSLSLALLFLFFGHNAIEEGQLRREESERRVSWEKRESHIATLRRQWIPCSALWPANLRDLLQQSMRKVKEERERERENLKRKNERKKDPITGSMSRNRAGWAELELNDEFSWLLLLFFFLFFSLICQKFTGD